MDIFSEGIGEGSGFDPSTDVAAQEAPATISEPTTDAALAEPTVQSEQGEAGQEAPAATDEKAAPSEDEIATLEKEVETALADEKTPKWFKNVVDNVYKPKMAALTEQITAFEPLQAFGTMEEVVSTLELARGLETVRSNPQTGMPELSTEPFVKALYEKDPKITYQLLNDLANVPSPSTPGFTVLHEILKQTGIDPTRLTEHKNFAANGYQLQASQYPAPDADELAQIPKELQSTYASLSPERREAMMADPESVRNATLEDAKTAIDNRTREATQKVTDEQRQQTETAERDRQFAQTVNTKGQEHFIKSSETVFTSFVDSLAKQANMTPMDSLMIANTVLNSFEPTLQGRQSLEMLQKEGIPVDPLLQTTLTQMQENSKHIAYFEAIQDRPNMERSVAKQVELQERVTAKANKIIAALALKKANGNAAPINTQNTLLAKSQNQTRYAAVGTGSQIGSSNGNQNLDFSDEGYSELLRASGFGRS